MENKLAVLLAFLFLSIYSYAQIEEDEFGFVDEDQGKPTLFESLSSEGEIPTVILTTDIKRILKHKNSLKSIPASLQYTHQGETHNWDIKLAARGKSRRKICYMPPLKLEFNKKDLKSEGIKKKYNSLKLVSYCKNQKAYEQYVLKEYLAYKLYNILSEHSFKVQLVHLEYRDSLERLKPVKRYGFIIENTDEMAKRLKSKEKSRYQLVRDSMDLHQHDVFVMFQYMISNSDWKIGGLHNTKIIRRKKTDTYAVIPYDFDYSGFVNANYSAPNVDLKQNHVRERIYMGECKDPKAFDAVRAHFKENKEEIYAEIEGFDLLGKRTRKHLYKYIKSFYKTIESDRKFKKKCIKMGRMWN